MPILPPPRQPRHRLDDRPVGVFGDEAPKDRAPNGAVAHNGHASAAPAPAPAAPAAPAAAPADVSVGTQQPLAPSPTPSWLQPATVAAPTTLPPPPATLPPPPPNAEAFGVAMPPHGTVVVNDPPPNGFEPTIKLSPVVDLRDPALVDAQSARGVPGTLVAEKLNAWFGSRKVLERCSLQMNAGRVTAIIGPSGCGKSVFLRNLNRMHEVIPTAKMGGTITLDGVDIHGEQLNVTEVRLRIGMVFQRPNPFPAMSIGENVLAGLKLAGIKPRGDRDDLIEWCLRRAGLWNETKDRLAQSGAALSGGQQQRLCIARALALRPKVLLMDEPCSALDPISTRVIEETIMEIASEITVVIVTHNMQQAQRISDDCALFLIEAIGEPGRIIETGPTSEVFTNPRDPRTEDYVTGRFG